MKLAACTPEATGLTYKEIDRKIFSDNPETIAWVRENWCFNCPILEDCARACENAEYGIWGGISVTEMGK